MDKLPPKGIQPDIIEEFYNDVARTPMGDRDVREIVSQYLDRYYTAQDISDETIAYISRIQNTDAYAKAMDTIRFVALAKDKVSQERITQAVAQAEAAGTTVAETAAGREIVAALPLEARQAISLPISTSPVEGAVGYGVGSGRPINTPAPAVETRGLGPIEGGVAGAASRPAGAPAQGVLRETGTEAATMASRAERPVVQEAGILASIPGLGKLLEGGTKAKLAIAGAIGLAAYAASQATSTSGSKLPPEPAPTFMPPQAIGGGPPSEEEELRTQINKLRQELAAPGLSNSGKVNKEAEIIAAQIRLEQDRLFRLEDELKNTPNTPENAPKISGLNQQRQVSQVTINGLSDDWSKRIELGAKLLGEESANKPEDVALRRRASEAAINSANANAAASAAAAARNAVETEAAKYNLALEQKLEPTKIATAQANLEKAINENLFTQLKLEDLRLSTTRTNKISELTDRYINGELSPEDYSNQAAAINNDYKTIGDNIIKREELKREETRTAIAEAGITGVYNGQPTLAAKQAERANAIGEAGVTGVFNGQPTIQAQEIAARNKFQQDQLAIQRAAEEQVRRRLHPRQQR